MTFVVDSDNNVLHDLVFHLAGQVEDGVLVGLDGLGGVNDEDERGVQRSIRGLAESALRRLRASLAPGGRYLVIHLDHHKMSKHLHIGSVGIIIKIIMIIKIITCNRRKGVRPHRRSWGQQHL